MVVWGKVRPWVPKVGAKVFDGGLVGQAEGGGDLLRGEAGVGATEKCPPVVWLGELSGRSANRPGQRSSPLIRRGGTDFAPAEELEPIWGRSLGDQARKGLWPSSGLKGAPRLGPRGPWLRRDTPLFGGLPDSTGTPSFVGVLSFTLQNPRTMELRMNTSERSIPRLSIPLIALICSGGLLLTGGDARAASTFACSNTRCLDVTSGICFASAGATCGFDEFGNCSHTKCPKE